MSIRRYKYTELLQGTLDLLILKALGPGERHGVDVAHRIEQITNGTFEVKSGSLFPALHRMEEAGWLAASWGESKNKRKAKFYRLTKAGRRQLESERDDWRRISGAITAALAQPRTENEPAQPPCRLLPESVSKKARRAGALGRAGTRI